MKSLLLIIVFLLGACTENKSANTKSTETQLTASYDKGLDLILLKSSFQNWFGGFYFLNSINFFQRVGAEPDTADYYAVYWDEKNNKYYYVPSSIAGIEKRSGIKFETETDHKHEQVLIPSRYLEKFTEERKLSITEFIKDNEIFDEIVPDFELLYVGSLSETQRIYVDPNSGDTFIKNIVPIDTSIYIDLNQQTNTTDLPFIPFITNTWGENGVEYTNNNNQRFTIDVDHYQHPNPIFEELSN